MAEANAQYVIDIAAQMPAGEQTIAELEALNKQLLASGVSAASLHDAIAQLSNELTAAKSASAAANAALAAGAEEYRTLETAALQAAKAAERAALKNGGAVPPELQARADQAAAALSAYGTQLQKLEAEAKQADSAQAKLNQDLTNARKLQKNLAGELVKSTKGFGAYGEQIEKLRSGLMAVGGPLGALGSGALAPVQGFAKLVASVGGANAALLAGVVGTTAMIAAVIALTAAMIAGTVAVAGWAIGLADANRSAKLTQEAIEAMNPEFVALRPAIEEASAATNAHADELLGLAKKLKTAKVAAKDLPEALKAAALAEAALGKGGADEFIEQIKAGKKAVGELSKETQQKLGGIVARQMKGLDAQTQTFRNHISEIFGGLNIEPVLNGLQTLVGLFDKSTAAGQTIQFLFETIFQPIIDGAETAAYAVEAFVLGFLIGATKLYIALKPVIKGISEFFGFASPELADTLAAVTKAGEVAFAVFAGGAALIGGAFTLALGVAALAAAPFALAIGAISTAIYGLFEAFTSAMAFIRSLDFGQIGADIINGLANGISAGASRVADALTGAVHGAVTAAKDFLGIHSPSTLLYDTVGEPMSAGVETALDDGKQDVSAALENMVEPPITPAVAAAAGQQAANDGPPTAAPSSGGKPSVTVIFNGVKDAEDALDRFAELATRLLEGDAASVSGAEVVA